MAPPIPGPKTTSTSAVMSRAATPRERKMDMPYTFQNGRSSSISYMTFIASITERNAPETPHKASRSETSAPTVNAPSALVPAMLKSWSSSKPTTSFGSTIRACSMRVFRRSGAPKRPSRESRKTAKGKSAKSPL
jgi:hypothetical protein